MATTSSNVVKTAFIPLTLPIPKSQAWTNIKYTVRTDDDPVLREKEQLLRVLLVYPDPVAKHQRDEYKQTRDGFRGYLHHDDQLGNGVGKHHQERIRVYREKQEPVPIWRHHLVRSSKTVVQPVQTLPCELHDGERKIEPGVVHGPHRNGQNPVADWPG